MKENRACPIHSADQADSVLRFLQVCFFYISDLSSVVCFCYFSLTRFSLGAAERDGLFRFRFPFQESASELALHGAFIFFQNIDAAASGRAVKGSVSVFIQSDQMVFS